jgi:hypothetical protein
MSEACAPSDSSSYRSEVLVAKGHQEPTPSNYEFRIKGHLDDRWSEWFYDLVITHESDGTTTLSGPLRDQTVLHSVLDRIRDMNLRLISVCSADDVVEIESDSGVESQSNLEGGAYTK